MSVRSELITNYSVIILKEMVKKAKTAKAKHEKARQRESTQTLGDVGTSRYWKTKGDVEFYFNEKQNVYKEMFELDCVAGWTSKLHQDRYSFAFKNKEIFDEYKEYVSTKKLKEWTKWEKLNLEAIQNA
ncbi:DUF1140 family protein [Brochothrix campestris]|uniref:Phage protein n=1 Tax=Brochothrix campestris FSL F6-1037 TaxID=1265861 RepID=W7CED0_9LIST|nr:DUF1140 family protein [Brochothrix campestris]EUJ34166.1 hypothetical protein BCAMP_12713 [Brochothrix campestris FSL F6-1037]